MVSRSARPLFKRAPKQGLSLIFQIHAVSADGQILQRRTLRRSQVLTYFQTLSPALVGMEACASAHYWAREIELLGHHVKIMPPSYVKPYVKRNKTDAADAEAICEAVTRPTMRFVPIKSVDQQAHGMVLKTRNLLMRQRSQTANALRAHLAELGIIAAAGMTSVSKLIETPALHGRHQPAGRGTSCAERVSGADRGANEARRAPRPRNTQDGQE